MTDGLTHHKTGLLHRRGQADAFPTDRLQWQDSDEDGFGDVPMGAKRDDCPEVAGTSTPRCTGVVSIQMETAGQTNMEVGMLPSQ
ncbi:MAG: hypothetical protein CM15mP9_4330 [Methanobacteriota archaeon]|nr:MAG: hypothetical protein CM15mP9_4330 [Euryarchaeota archaeon]